MTAPDVPALAAAIQAGDADRLREMLATATEKERGSLATTLKSVFERPGRQASESHWRAWHQWSQQPAAFVTAGLGLVGGYRLALAVVDRPGNWEVTAVEYDAIAGVLADRAPAWLGEFIDQLLSRSWDQAFPSWPLARRLVRLGAINRPAADEYAVKMIMALIQRPLRERRKPSASAAERLAAALLDDPGLLDDEVWRLFSTLGAGQGLQGTGFQVGDQWADALTQLAARGHLDRGRLLDACLDAFLRDFPPNHVAWYALVHDRLQPSADEKAARTGRYVALLAAPGKPGLAVGQRGCAELLDAGLLDPAAFLAGSPPALLHPQKAVATAQLKIIGKLAARQPAVRAAALATAAQAFSHQRADVQAAALALIAKFGAPVSGATVSGAPVSGAAAPEAVLAGQRDAIVELAAFLSPELRPEAAALGLVPAPGRAVTVAPVAAPGMLSAPPPERVLPVTDPAELVQLLAQLMEDATDALAVERALDGAVRLSALPLPERAKFAEPLLKRARQQAAADFPGPFSGYLPRAELAWLTLTWATGEMPPEHLHRHFLVGNPVLVTGKERHGATPRSVSGIRSARGWEACGLIADGHGYPLLATPEFDDGSISAGELASRLASWPAGGPRPPRNDGEVAMLRLAPGAEAILPADLLAAYAPAQPALSLEPYVVLPKVTVHSRPDLPGIPGRTWQAQDGHPGVFARHASAGVAISPEASWCGHLVTALPPREQFSRYSWVEPELRSSEVVAAWPLLTPHHPELAAAHLLSALSAGLDGSSAAAPAVTAAARLRGPFGPLGHVALAAGLASGAADARIAAADAWAQVARTGRLDPGLAAAAITLGPARRR